MKEPIFNLFIYVDTPMIKELGVSVHYLEGTDQENIATLQKLVAVDCKTATHYKTKCPYTWQYYQGLLRIGRELDIFEEIFRCLNAPESPLVLITPIVDEQPYCEVEGKIGQFRLDSLKGTPLEEPGMMIDYLETYITVDGFDIPRLLNDDYLLAVKLLFNNRHYVSCAKLFMSFIDSISFIDAGDIKNGFTAWLDKYADLSTLGITSKELWEFRNGLMHMTNLYSRAVVNGNTAPLIFFVGNPTEPLPPCRNGAKYFNLKGLIDVIANAVSRWIDTYNQNPEKMADFISRYDLTISDARMAYMSSSDISGTAL